jgi:hypothetical protein
MSDLLFTFFVVAAVIGCICLIVAAFIDPDDGD